MSADLIPQDVFDRYRRLQRYVGWSDRDSQRIRDLAPVVRPAFDALVEDFYTAIRNEPEALRVITGGDAQIARLKLKLHSWLEDLLSGRYDEPYVERRWKTGWRHVEIGLDQMYVNVAMSRLRAGLIRALESRWQGAADKLSAASHTLNRLLDLDLAIIQDAYEREHLLRQQHVERARGEVAFRRLVEAAGCMIVMLRSDHTIAYFNPFAERITGYAAEDVLGKDYLPLFLPAAERDGVASEVHRVISGGAPSHGYENPVLCRDGSQHWMAWNAQRLDDYRGAPAVLAVGHDITQRKQAEDSLRDREARLRSILETAVDGIITIDPQGIVQSINPAAEQMFGYGADEVIGRNVKMLMPAPFRDEHDRYLRNYLETGEKHIIGIGREVSGRRKDGSTFALDLAVSEVHIGTRRMFTGIVRDLTEQKDAEDRALRAERLAAIGQTVAGLAHESRNAFQRSQACLEMLAMDLEGQPDQLELVARIQRALDHLHHLYEEVRDYASPIKLDLQPCDLAHVWRDAWAHLEVLRKSKSVDLHESIAGVDLTCSVDWFAMGQVFRNILENAVSACPNPGRIEIIGTESSIFGQSAIQVAIRDNGPGISPDARDRIFDAFFTTKTKGTGLGMAIANRIVEAHGGRIAVGDGGEGAEILVMLPRT